jgi:ubiquinone/menaquinone biosynthesis C-methylase UbiE
MAKFSESQFAARLQNLISRLREESGMYLKIAKALPLRVNCRVLDVGTGSGFQLKVIHELDPNARLYGIDLSREVILEAGANLRSMAVDLRVESIEETTFEDGFFDVVTCNASLSYLRHLSHCFNEIHRILKPGGGQRSCLNRDRTLILKKRLRSSGRIYLRKAGCGGL